MYGQAPYSVGVNRSDIRVEKTHDIIAASVEEYQEDSMMNSLGAYIRHTLQPPLDSIVSCGAFFVDPAGKHPVAMLIPCQKNFQVRYIICSLAGLNGKLADQAEESKHSIFQTIFSNSTIEVSKYSCSKGWFPLIEHCVTFFESKDSSVEKCSANDATLFDIISLDNIRLIKIFTQTMSYHLMIRTAFLPYFHEGVLHKDEYEVSSSGKYQFSHYILCAREALSQDVQACRQGYFTCDNRECISDSFVCNGHNNCLGGEDETKCITVCIIQGQNKFSLSDCSDVCKPSECQCGEMFYQCSTGSCIPSVYTCDRKNDCEDNSDEMFCIYPQAIDEKNMFTCAITSTQIPMTRVNDLVPDCPGFQAEDEEFYKEIIRTRLISRNVDTIVNYCDNIQLLSCVLGHSHCFPSDKLCVFDQDTDGSMLYCRSGSHLRGCQYFVCNQMFKCPQSFCLPFHKLCDGTAHCIDGEDEMLCDHAWTCPGMLRCQSGSCVGIDYVCDGIPQCQFSEDEEYCNLDQCPHGCSCLGASYNCSHSDLTEIPGESKDIRILLLPHNAIELCNTSLPLLPYLLRLNLAYNNISCTNAYQFQWYENLQFLSLAENRIKTILSHTFDGLSMLRVLELEGNIIKLLHGSAFNGLFMLEKLQLHDQCLEDISTDSFKDLVNVKKLNLSNNKLGILDTSMLRGMRSLQHLDLSHNKFYSVIGDKVLESVKIIHADHKAICCIAKDVDYCLVEKYDKENLNCQSIFQTHLMRATIWTLSSVSFLANLFVIFYRLLFQKFTNKLNTIFLNMAFADILLVGYFLSVCCADASFYGSYGLRSLTWRSSIFCKMLSFSAYMSSISSLVVAVELSCVYVIVFGRYFELDLSKRNKFCLCAFSWLVPTTVGSVSFISSFRVATHRLVATDFCFGFNLGTGLVPGWYYTVLPHFIITVILIICLDILCLKAVCIVTTSARRVKEHGTVFGRKKTRKSVGLLIVFLLTNSLSWFPTTVLMVFTMAGVYVDQHIVLWLVIMSLLVNTIINPIMHTIRHFLSSKK